MLDIGIRAFAKQTSGKKAKKEREEKDGRSGYLLLVFTQAEHQYPMIRKKTAEYPSLPFSQTNPPYEENVCYS